ncbi:hypothetical protein NDU88_006929 [Pleurodeles waltl]|uniref:Uncharacterized protein n=1 Tax=Pleurodeles waltl TaxID=8319 RepID=A0AAV7NVF7_PLEWA|nr:hypothetical protein NDU88_006929 [Pleurodeles waltl]
MEGHGSPTFFSPEENQEEVDIWTRFLAMGKARGLEWAKKMVAAQGGQQPLETSPRRTRTRALAAGEQAQDGFGGRTPTCRRVAGRDFHAWAEVADTVALDTIAGGSDKMTVIRPDPPLLSGRLSLAWRVPLEARERIRKREFIDIFSLLTFAKEGADITVPSRV